MLRRKFIPIILITAILFITLAVAENLISEKLSLKPLAQPVASEKIAIRKAVEKYVDTLVKAYWQGTPMPLNEVATENQVRTIRLNMAWNHFEKKQKLLPNLHSLHISKVVTTGKKQAEVYTDEDWSYRYIEEATSKTAFQTRERYQVRYQLVKSSGEWLVDSAKVLKKEKVN